jgi:hypothetical protein
LTIVVVATIIDAMVATAAFANAIRHSVLIAASDGSTVLKSGGSATPFTIKLPKTAACPGDSEHRQFYVDTYVVPVTTDPGTLVFAGGWPTVGTVLVTAAGDAYTAQTTAVDSGQILTLPVFSWGPFAPHRDVLPNGTYNVGIMCADRSSHAAAYWNSVVTLSESRSDRGGFVWTIAGDPTAKSTSGDGTAVIIVSVVVVLAVTIGGSFALWRWRRQRNATASAHS